MLAAVTTVGALALLPGAASAYIYFTSPSFETDDALVGRADLDGSNLNPALITIPPVPVPGSAPYGLAVDGSYIYFTNGPSNKDIGRADLDGSNVISPFVSPGFPQLDLAVDASRIYFTEQFLSFSDGVNEVYFVDLDGSNPGAISLPDDCTSCPIVRDVPVGWSPRSLAVNATHIYWANGGDFEGTIGRANIDGTGVDARFITAPTTGVSAVTVSAHHIYWASGGDIGRAELDGSNADLDFIDDVAVSDLAVHGGHLYWTGQDAIGRANLDGTGVNPGLITGLHSPAGIAVDGLGPQPTADSDGDGIEDPVDTDAGSSSDAFDDGDGTSGSIADRGGLGVAIADAAAPDGVRVTTGAGSGEATLSACGSTVTVAAQSEAILTCGSVQVQVVSGSAEIVLGDGLTVVSIPAGVTAKVTENPDGSFELENLGGGDVTVSVDGVEATVGAGETTQLRAWDFVGFNSPVDSPPVMNVVGAGQVVPLRWRLLEADGSPVTTLASARLTVSSLACDLDATPDLLEETSPGASGLKHLGNGSYELGWKTPKGYAKSCKTLHLDLGEGITRDAYFRFKK